MLMVAMVAVFTSTYTHGRHRMVAVITSAYAHGRHRMVAVITSAYTHGRHGSCIYTCLYSWSRW